MGFKEFCGEGVSFLDHYSKFINRDKPLPSWSDADVEAFIATDPVHGPALKTAREAAKYAASGSVIGAVSTAGFAWKYSRSLHGFQLFRNREAARKANFQSNESIMTQLAFGFAFEHHYHMNVFNVLINFQMSELNRRYLEQASELLTLSSSLDPRDEFKYFKTEDVCNLAKKFYPEDFDDGEMCTLELECAYYEKDLLGDPKFKNLECISDLCHMLVQTRKSEFYPMIYRLMCLVLTILVSTTTTERAFSAMNIVKNRIRSKLEDEFLDDCMFLHIEKEYADSIDNAVVIEDFESLSNRKVKFS